MLASIQTKVSVPVFFILIFGILGGVVSHVSFTGMGQMVSYPFLGGTTRIFLTNQTVCGGPWHVHLSEFMVILAYARPNVQLCEWCNMYCILGAAISS